MIGIGIAGKSGAGKSTLAGLVLDELRARGRDALAVSFADPLLEELQRERGLERGQPGWLDGLRRLDAERRALDEGYWLKATAAYVSRLREAGVVAVLDDVRLRREADGLAAAGVGLVRVEASQRLRAERLVAQGLEPSLARQRARSPEPTECELDDWPGFALTLRNSGQLETLRRQAAKVAALVD